LIGQDGAQQGVLSLADALSAAKAAEMDLVQVMADSDPPVCKLMDYGKYRYKRKRQTHQAKSHIMHIKEIRLHPKTGQHDIDYRVKHAREFLAKGDKVLVSVLYSGRELAHIEVGAVLIDRVIADLADVAKVETPPKREGRRMSALLAPK
jgi:translation initiation factor IF-3